MCAVNVLVLSIFFAHAFSILDFPLGSQVTIQVPSVYQQGFVGRAFLLGPSSSSQPPPQPPGFRVALNIEAVEGSYSCSLVVLLWDVKVWASDHFVKFFPNGICMLALTNGGDLQLNDQAAEIGWSSGTFGQGVQVLRLIQSIGNLVLIDAKNQTTWQSFNFPANVMLWSQRLNQSSHLTCFLFNDSSEAFYSLEVQQYKLKAYLNWRNKKYSYWELNNPSNVSIAFIRLASSGLKILKNNSRKIGQIVATDSNPVRFMALGSKGNLNLYYYSASQGKFISSYRALEFCDLPLPCGPYGICSYTNTCTSLQLSETQYNIVRALKQGASNGFCGEYEYQVEMIELERTTTVLRTSAPMANISNQECLTLCLKDCSCAAALYLNDNGGSKSGSLCHHFSVAGGAKEVDEATEDSYWLKIPKENSVNETSGLLTKVLIAGGVIDGVALVVISGGLLYYFFNVRKEQHSGTNNN